MPWHQDTSYLAASGDHLANLWISFESLPKANVPSVTVDFLPRDSSLAEFAASLRASNPHVIGYIADNRFKLDLRTIFLQQDDLVIEAIRATCTK